MTITREELIEMTQQQHRKELNKQLKLFPNTPRNCFVPGGMPAETTLREAREDVSKWLDHGIRCPVCQKYARRYRRPFNATMARSLCWLVKASEEATETKGWVHVPSLAPRWLIRSNQLSTVRWWNLVKRKETEDPEGRLKHGGFWKPTKKGIQFAYGDSTIPSKVITYDGVTAGYEGERVWIEDLSDKKFNYQEIMGWDAEE